MFYVKDIAKLRQMNTLEREDAEEAIADILENPPTEEEIVQIVQKREDELMLKGFDMFKKGDKLVTDQLEDIQQALIKKDGIVDTDQQDIFRERIERTFNTQLIH